VKEGASVEDVAEVARVLLVQLKSGKFPLGRRHFEEDLQTEKSGSYRSDF
jgi:hypothetical protein